MNSRFTRVGTSRTCEQVLYWNVMVTVVKGEPHQVRLTRENAEERIKL